jgi:hypothetical protein
MVQFWLIWTWLRKPSFLHGSLFRARECRAITAIGWYCPREAGFSSIKDSNICKQQSVSSEPACPERTMWWQKAVDLLANHFCLVPHLSIPMYFLPFCGHTHSIFPFSWFYPIPYASFLIFFLDNYVSFSWRKHGSFTNWAAKSC